MKRFTPTVLYSTKLINLDQIETIEEKGQSRVSGLDTNNLQEVETSIAHKGLQENISVEAINIDDQNEDNSTYRLRDGNHRFAAFQNLRKKHKNSKLYNKIKCTVYEKNAGTKAESDWLHWQHQKNEHLDKAHKSNTFDDSTYTAYKLLMDGYLGNEAAALAAKGDWDNSLVDHVLTDWIKSICKRISVAKREDMLDQIHSRAGHLRKSKIKRYNNSDLSRITMSEYGVVPKRGGAKSPNANNTIWTATGDTFHAIVLRPVFQIFEDGSKTSNNIIIHHCKKGDIDTIDTKRKSAEKMINTINDWFSANIPAFKHVKVIDDVKFLGQKLANEYGEKDGEFI